MYKINLISGSSLNYTGAEVDPETRPIELSNGWNWIGYLPQNQTDINTALASLSSNATDYIKGQTVSSTYYASGGVWYPDILLEPTKGYMIKSSLADNLIYPETIFGMSPKRYKMLEVP